MSTNISELADFFPASGSNKREAVKVVGVPSLLPGETYEQAVVRRAENAKRIEEKLAAKRAAKAEAS
jgi:hypothetical protein